MTLAYSLILSSWLVSSYEIKIKTKPGDTQGEMTLAYSLILSSWLVSSYEIKIKTKPGDTQGEMTLAYSLDSVQLVG